MISEHLSEGTSYLHDFDPRLKIIVALIYSVTVALLTSFPLLLLSLFFSLILVFWARLSSGTVFKRLLVVNGFVIFLWFILPFSYDGKELISLGPLVATDVGVYQVLRITIKSNAIIMCLMALLSTSPTFMLVHALHHLKVPSKLVHLFFFTYRYIHVIYTEFVRLNTAMKIRCFTPRTDLHTYRTYAYLVGMLLVRSYERSKRIYQSMLCRGFNGKFHTLYHFESRPKELLSAAAMTTFVLLIAIGQWLPLGKLITF